MIPEIIIPESTVVFNPHFGIMSQSCGGADAIKAVVIFPPLTQMY